MKILIANLPSFKGKMFVKEGRCSQSKKFWNTIWPPYSLVSLAAVLEQSGNKVRVYNYPADSLKLTDFSEFIKEFSPDAVIASCTTPTITDDLAAASLIKRLSPQTKIIFFGIHGSVFFEDILQNSPFVDFIIRGEPEITARELIAFLKGEPGLKCKDIRGLVWRDMDTVISNEDRPLISNLDDLPFPAWHLVDIRKYKLPFIGKPYLLVVPGRGCVDKCLFCYAHKYYGRKNRRHSAERMIKEMIYYRQRFGINRFFFWTENFTQDRKFLGEMLDLMLERRLDVRWSCNSRVDTADFALFKKMKKAGCQMIAFGVESGNQNILDAARKEITLEQIETAFARAHKAGLQTIANCIFGLPGESQATMRQTMKFLERLNPTYAQFYTAVPRPGSEFYELACRKNWLESADWSRFHQGDYVLNIDGLRGPEVTAFISRARIGFYLKPGRLIRIFFNLAKAFVNL